MTSRNIGYCGTRNWNKANKNNLVEKQHVMNILSPCFLKIGYYCSFSLLVWVMAQLVNTQRYTLDFSEDEWLMASFCWRWLKKQHKNSRKRMDKTVDRELPATPEIQHTSRWPKKWWFGKGSSLKYFKTIVILGIHIRIWGVYVYPVFTQLLCQPWAFHWSFSKSTAYVASSKGVPGLLMKGSWKKCLWNPYFLYITLLSKHRKHWIHEGY